jgi:hypothetical protein
MKSLIDLKKELKENRLTSNLYIFTGEENYIRKLYYQKIAEIYGNLKSFESVNDLYKELEKRSLFAVKSAYFVYNDTEFLKQKEKVYERLLKLCKDKVVILVFEEIPEKGPFRNVLDDYITIFNKVSDDIAIKYVSREYPIKDMLFAQKIAFNCYNSYNNIIEEMNKYRWFKEDNPDHAIDAMTYACLFFDRKEKPTPRDFANAFLQRNSSQLKEYLKLLKDENILGYLPELYNTIVLALYLKLYGKYDGGTRAYNAGEYWGRVKEIRNFNISYTKDDLLDIRYLLYQLDLDIRSGRMKAELAWDWLIGVIL